jgi:hypothetical protein
MIFVIHDQDGFIRQGAPPNGFIVSQVVKNGKCFDSLLACGYNSCMSEQQNTEQQASQRAYASTPAASRFRRSLLWSGLAGMFPAAMLAVLSTWLINSGILPVLLPQPIIRLLLVLILGGFSLAEIPMMIFAMRRLASERRSNHGFVLAINALYVFFAGIYGAPVMLLTGSLGWGWALCSLSIVRLAASLLFVRQTEPPQP